MAHHKGKRQVAKSEMIALARALEQERDLRRAVTTHVASSATPKAMELAAALEAELRRFEEALVVLSSKAGRPWSPGQSVRAPAGLFKSVPWSPGQLVGRG